jgi:hypothetical protein
MIPFKKESIILINKKNCKPLGPLIKIKIYKI